MRVQINLLPGERKKKAAGGPGFKLPDFKAIFAQVKDPWLAAAAGIWIAVGAVAVITFLAQARELAQLEPEVTRLRTEKRRYDQRLAEMRRAQKLLDTLTTELGIIGDIDADRFTWAHILDQISKALPQYTWLTDLTGTTVQDTSDSTGRTRSVNVDVNGRTVDVQAYSTFLRQLAASPWLAAVTPVNVTSAVEANRPVSAFSINMRFRHADSAYIRFVPVFRSGGR
jgi:Tfp pilus assembly protein PilN